MDKKLGLFGITIGSIIGGYVPSLFGASAFTVWAVITSTIGAAIGLWLAYRFSS